VLTIFILEVMLNWCLPGYLSGYHVVELLHHIVCKLYYCIKVTKLHYIFIVIDANFQHRVLKMVSFEILERGAHIIKRLSSLHSVKLHRWVLYFIV